MMENFRCANKVGWQIYNLSKSECRHISVFDGGIVGKTWECAFEFLIHGPSLLVAFKAKDFPRTLEDFPGH